MKKALPPLSKKKRDELLKAFDEINGKMEAYIKRWGWIKEVKTIDELRERVKKMDK